MKEEIVHGNEQAATEPIDVNALVYQITSSLKLRADKWQKRLAEVIAQRDALQPGRFDFLLRRLRHAEKSKRREAERALRDAERLASAIKQLTAPR